MTPPPSQAQLLLEAAHRWEQYRALPWASRALVLKQGHIVCRGGRQCGRWIRVGGRRCIGRGSSWGPSSVTVEEEATEEADEGVVGTVVVAADGLELWRPRPSFGSWGSQE